MVSFQVIGNDTAVAYAVQAGPTGVERDDAGDGPQCAARAITILANMLREFDERCVRGITANVERCNFYAQSTVSLATALNPYIGYAKAAELVKESSRDGRVYYLYRAQKEAAERRTDL